MEIFQSRCVFPKLENDILLYLALMGTSKYSAFYSKFEGFDISDARCKLTFVTALKKWLKMLNYRVSKFDPSNVNQAQNDGLSAKFILCGACIAASHSQGLRSEGMDGLSFLNRLVIELIDGVDDNFQINSNQDHNEIFAFLKSLRVPFCLPPDQEIPRVLADCFRSEREKENLPHLFAEISRTNNQSRIDIRCVSHLSDPSDTCFFTGESMKDYSDKLMIPKIKEIILRIPNETKLHIVFTNQLQKKYFKDDENYLKWSQDEAKSTNEKANIKKNNQLAFEKRSNTVFFKVCSDGNLSPISHLPYRWNKNDTNIEKKCLVLFILARMFCHFISIFFFLRYYIFLVSNFFFYKSKIFF